MLKNNLGARKLMEEEKRIRFEKMEGHIRTVIDEYMVYKLDLDEAMYKLLHQSSPIKGWLKRKARRFLLENHDLSMKYTVDDIYSLLTEVVWNFVKESLNRYEEILSYIGTLNYRCKLKLISFKRYFLARKRSIERLTTPKDDDSLDNIRLNTIANGNYYASTYRSDEKKEKMKGGSFKNGNYRKVLITGYESSELENRLLVNEMLASSVLPAKDRKLLEYLYVNPSATLFEMMINCEFTSKKAVSRGIERIKRQYSYILLY
ncbi:hypothetical protein FO497_13475 [Bacillus cereus ATCC 10876]|uniref:hypothetical protein n=1 Tax=Bacillus TaxID=1386 RepID=UPI00050767DD|nr:MULTISPECIES: hypothetical protein [Bacillus]MDJ0280710.1 hypothetical protein [Bacillus bombysepticus]KFL79011.1 hypothetical protein DJ50_5366 [Bacillus cereus ATCC 10876]MBG9866018.1 hypothetical protein [Bacillus cereus]MBO1128292.1 hypothetical protein [Bacillus cereus]MDJ0294669.1 hypothetical protein [Bacillus bombysepticus]